MNNNINISTREMFLRHVAQTSPTPMGLKIARSEGVFLFDDTGKSYLDLISGIGPSVLGHQHPVVKKAIEDQLNLYWHTLVYGEFVLSPQVALSTLLSQQLGRLDSVYFVNSGAEATEGAMKLAKRYTGRHRFLACRNAYHGSTQGAASLMSPTTFTQAFYPLLPGIGHIDFNGWNAIDNITTDVAAVILEPIQGEAGVVLPDIQWLKAVREKCSETGTLLILDEIQSGYGRTGTLFAYQQLGIEPDILLTAKGFGGGMPLAAFIAPQSIMDCLTHQPVLGHITTFGGHPVCAAAGLATLEVLLQSDLMVQARIKGQIFRENLQHHPAVQAYRTIGLWAAIDLGSFDAVQQVIAHCLKKGLITDWFLFNERSIRLAPPLTIQQDEIKFACEVLQSGLDHL